MKTGIYYGCVFLAQLFAVKTTPYILFYLNGNKNENVFDKQVYKVGLTVSLP